MDAALSDFERVIYVNGADILRYIQARADGGVDAAEVYGDTLLTAWRARRRMPVDEIQARMWLFGVARRVLSNSRRSAARRFAAVQRLKDRLAVEPQDETSAEALDFRAAIAALPPEMAEIVRLFYWDGFTSEEIAQILAVPASTIRTRLGAARTRLRESLGMRYRIVATGEPR